MALPVTKLGHSDKQTAYVDMIIYGPSGAGKTYRAATAPGPIYMISPDPTGHKSVPFPVNGIVPKTIQEIFEVCAELRKGGHGYKTIVLDGLSFMHDMWVRDMGRYYTKIGVSKDPDLLPLQGRMKIQNQYRNLLLDMINLTQHPDEKSRVHFIATTLDAKLQDDNSSEDEESGAAETQRIRPAFGTDKMNRQFPASFSVISYIKPSGVVNKDGSVDETRYMLFTNKRSIMARDRLHIFPQQCEAVNLSEYLNKK